MSSDVIANDLVKLVEELANRSLAGGSQAQITLINNCPSSWNVTIVSAGVKFFYRDGSDYTDGPRTINLTSGQSATFVSNDPEQCVYQFFLAMVVYIPKEGTKTLTFQDGVPEGECLIHESVILGPKAKRVTISARSHKATKISELLRMTSGSLKIESLDPSTAKVGWEGALTINGSNLGSPGFVGIEGKDPKIKSWTAREIIVEVTKSITDSAGSKRLFVHDADGNFDETRWNVEV